MPYDVRRNYQGCRFAVVKSSDGTRVGCHPTLVAAQRHMAALYANVHDAQKDMQDAIEDPAFWERAREIMVGTVEPIFLEAYLAGQKIADAMRVRRVRGAKFNVIGNTHHDRRGRFAGSLLAAALVIPLPPGPVLTDLPKASWPPPRGTTPDSLLPGQDRYVVLPDGRVGDRLHPDTVYNSIGSGPGQIPQRIIDASVGISTGSVLGDAKANHPEGLGWPTPDGEGWFWDWVWTDENDHSKGALPQAGVEVRKDGTVVWYADGVEDKTPHPVPPRQPVGTRIPGVSAEKYNAEGNPWHDEFGRFAGPESGGGGAAGRFEGQSRVVPSLTAAMRANIPGWLAKNGWAQEQLTQNVRALVEGATADQRAEGLAWYGTAHEVATNLAQAYGIPPEQAMGVLAALSPQADWAKNIQMADTVLSLALGHPFTTEAQDQIDMRAAYMRGVPKPPSEAKVAEVVAELTSILGTQPTDTIAPNVLGTSMHLSQTEDNLEKAVRIARGENPRAVLTGYKVESFYDNIKHPTLSPEVTIDGHMAQAVANDPHLTTNQAANITTIAGHYDAFSTAIRTVAEEQGILPSQTQAIAWVRWIDLGAPVRAAKDPYAVYANPMLGKALGEKLNLEGNPNHDELGRFPSGDVSVVGGIRIWNPRGSTPKQVEEFKQEYDRWGEKDPVTGERIVGHAAFVAGETKISSDRGEYVEVESVRSLQKGSNDAIIGMSQLTEMADRHGVVLRLHVTPFNFGPEVTPSVIEDPARLQQFYGHFGFRSSWVGSNTMYREPKKSAQKAIEEAFEAAGLKYNATGNPYHDERGQFTDEAGDVSPGGLLAKLTEEEGGFTYQPVTKEMPEKGFALSLFPSREMVLDDGASHREMAAQIKGYLRANRPLTGVPSQRAYIGGWHDEEAGKVYLDVSVVLDDEAQARELAISHNQEAYFNLGTGESVYVHAREKEAGEGSDSLRRDRRGDREGSRDAAWSRSIEAAFAASGLKFNAEGNPWHGEHGWFAGPGSSGSSVREQAVAQRNPNELSYPEQGAFDAFLASVPSVANAPLSQTSPVLIEAVQDDLRASFKQDGYEHWIGLNKNGDVVAAVCTNGRTEVLVPHEYNERAVGLQAHCHPDNASFSPEDVRAGIRAGTREMMVVTPRFTAYLRPNKVDAEGKGVWNEDKLGPAFTAARGVGMREVMDRRVFGRPMATSHSNNGWHQVWQQVADAADLTYELRSPDGRLMEVKAVWAAPTLVPGQARTKEMDVVLVYA